MPAVVTTVGVVTVTPLNVQLTVNPVVINCLVKSKLLPAQMAAALSIPKSGLGLMDKVNRAVSEQLLLLLTII